MNDDTKLQRLIVYMSLFKVSKAKLSQRIGCDVAIIDKYFRGTLEDNGSIFNNIIIGLGTMINSDVQMFLLYNYVERDLLNDYNTLIDKLKKYEADVSI